MLASLDVLLLSSLALSGCTSRIATTGQSALDLHLVVHIDPLVRRGDEGCEDDRLHSCGSFSPEPWRERIDNLSWLSERWVETGRTMDLQWGPEMAFTLAEDPAHLDNLVAGYESDGEPDPWGAVAEGIAVGQGAIAQALDAGVATFSTHVHTVVPDPSGYWGAGPLSSDTDPHPCDAFSGDPLAEAPLDTVEAVVFYGASGASALSDLFDEPLRSFTGSVPRVMGNKILALSDPDALDPSVGRDFPDAWAPWLLGGAYSECMMRAAGHPPFELYHASDSRSLGGGDGPLVHPGEPVVGNMAVHLGLPGDGAPGAAMRRILMAMLNWRVAALTDQPDRPWAYSFHTHLFHLYPGAVAALDPGAREVSAVTGASFRGDLESVAAFADRFAGGSWQGLSSSQGGGPLRWALPGDQDPLQADFVFGEADQAPPDELDGRYPYLPLLAQELDHANLVCTGRLDGVEVYGLLRCGAGWAWGGDHAGFHCADETAADWRYVLVPGAASCLAVDTGGSALLAASVMASSWADPPWCEGGLVVPPEGLLVASTEALPTLSDACSTGLATGG